MTRKRTAMLTALVIVAAGATYVDFGRNDDAPVTAKLIKLNGARSTRIQEESLPPVTTVQTPNREELIPIRMDGGRTPGSVPRQVVIRTVPGARRAEVEAAAARADGHILSRLVPLEDTYLVQIRRGVEEAVAELEREEILLYAEPNFIYTTSDTYPSDSSFQQQWALHNVGQVVGSGAGTADADIDGPTAWDVTTGGETVVAVVDSGVAYNHPELRGNSWTNPDEVADNGVDEDQNGYADDIVGWDFVERDNMPLDPIGHGTHVAGTIGAGANNEFPVTGVIWDVEIMPVRALDAQGLGTSAAIATALKYAADQGAHVVNGSFGGPGQSLAIADAIAQAPDTIFVFAAGNEGANNDVTPSYPCAYPSANVVCVGATDQNDRLAAFSNYGETTVDLAAPGSRILNTAPGRVKLFSEDFEQQPSRWTSGGTNNSWGVAQDAHGFYLSDSPGTAYLNDSDSFFELIDPLPTTAVDSCYLTYALRLDTESQKDGLLIEASVDDGAWQRIVGYSGSTSGNWVAISNSLSAFDGAASLQIRFGFRSDGQNEAEGVDIDDVAIHCLSTSYTGGEVAFLSGTSMAAPHVAGAVALLEAAAAPDVTAGQLIAHLLHGVDPLPDLSRKMTSGGRLNAANALQLVTGAAAPTSPGAAPTTPAPATPSATNTGQVSRGGGGGAAPAPTTQPAPATASPSPTATPTQDAQASPSPNDTPGGATPSPSEEERRSYVRTITLRLRRHLVARGVARSEAPDTCASNARVIVKRNKKIVARTRADDEGVYRVRIPDRIGHYRAIIKADRSGCEQARSLVHRHRHD